MKFTTGNINDFMGSLENLATTSGIDNTEDLSGSIVVVR